MDEPRTVSAFEHENALMHYGKVNKRSMIMLISVCVTCILIVTIFVVSVTYRERMWIDALRQAYQTEVAADDGVHQQQNP